MPIGTPVAVGQSGSVGAGSTVTATLTGAVPSGALVLFALTWSGADTKSLADNGAGLTYAIDKTQALSTHRLSLGSAQAPAGLASGTVVTATVPASSNNLHLAVAYCTGLATSSVLDQTNGGSDAGGASTWNTGNVTTTVADELLWGACFKDSDTADNTATTGTELQEWNNGNAQTNICTLYDIKSATGTYSLAGSWGADTAEQIYAIASYKIAGAAAATAPPPLRRRRMRAASGLTIR